MARTRVDPWQNEPESFWKDTALSTIIPSYSSHPDTNSFHSKPKSSVISNVNKHVPESLPSFKANLPSMPLPDFKAVSSLKSPHSKSKPLSTVHSTFHSSKNNSASHLKLKLKRKHKSNDDFNKAASKVLAALNMTNINRPSNKFFEYTIPKKRKRLELPDGDKRKNMIPKVVLRDIGHVISLVCPKLKTPPDSPSHDGFSSSSLTGEERHKNENQQWPPTCSPKSPASRGKRLPVVTVPDTPELILDPPVVTLEEPPVVTLDDAPLVTIGTAEVIIGDTSTLPEMSPTNIMNGISLALTQEVSAVSSSSRKSPVRSEKSSTPVSRKTASFDKLGSLAPSFPKLATQSSSSTVWPQSSTPGPSYPLESVSSIFTKARASTGHESIPAQPKKSSTSNDLNSKEKRQSKKGDPELVELEPKKSSTSNDFNSKEKRQSKKGDPELVELEPATINPDPAVVNPGPATKQVQSTPVPIEIIADGFPGFPQEDGKKLKKTRFHVNTNILASSLDILDLHQNSEGAAGSPSSCAKCNIVFSSVKHCKYHQSVVSSDLDPARHHNVQEGDVWLCPWCPLMSFSNEFLNKHKEVCREKDRCQQEPKASSSVRKSAPSSSRRRSTLPGGSSSSSISPSNNSFKIVHGFVIPV